MKQSYFIKTLLGFLLCLLIFTGSCCINTGCWPRAKYERTDKLYAALEPNSVLIAETDVGSISNISGEIKAKTDVGKIKCKEISGDIDLKTDVGEVKVVYCETAPALRNASIKTDVGGIDFTVPTDFSATVDAKTDVGSISTELPMTVKGKVSKSLHGTIGEGKSKVNLSTDV